MEIMDNKIVVNSRLILSEKQLYLIMKFSGFNDDNAKELAEFYYKNPDKASDSFSNFCLEYSEEGATINNLIILGLLAYAKTKGETLEDKDIYIDYITASRPLIKEVEYEYVEVEDQYVDTLENMYNNGLLNKYQRDLDRALKKQEYFDMATKYFVYGKPYTREEAISTLQKDSSFKLYPTTAEVYFNDMVESGVIKTTPENKYYL